MSDCLSDDAFIRLSDGEMTDAELADLERHIARCQRCAEIAREVAHSFEPGERGVPWIHPGAQVGRYRIVSWLGSGGMGQVYVARDPQLGREIALKLVRGDEPDSRQALLLREAKAMAQLADPNVVAVHDAGVADGRAFIAMEWVRGVSLGEWAAQGRSAAEIADALIDAGRGLWAAHQKGILHRDFKPSNVLVGDDGRVMVSDFGLARIADAEGPGFAPRRPSQASTVTDGVAGTPPYMAPERRGGQAASVRSDQFSYCVSFWELYLGSRPPRTLDKKPADPIARVLARGLDPDPEERFADMGELLAAIDSARRPSRKPWLWTAAAALAAGAALLAWNHRGGDGDPPPTCGTPFADVDAAWHDQAAAVRADFVAAAGPRAGEVWPAIAGLLDRYSADYVAANRSACIATYVDHRQSPELLDQRLRCFQDRRRELAGIVQIYRTLEARHLDYAVLAPYRLVPLAECDEHRVLARAPGPPPDDARRSVDSIRGKLTDAWLDVVFGRVEEASEILEPLAAEAGTVGYPAIEAEVLWAVAQHRRILRDYTNIEKPALEALSVAESAGDTYLSAHAAIELAYAAMHLEKPAAEIDKWLTLAEAKARRVRPEGGPTALDHSIATARRAVAESRGDYAAALEHARQTLAAAREVYGPDGVQVASAYAAIAALLDSLGRSEEAIAALEHNLAVLEAALSPDHRDVQYVLSRLAVANGRAGHKEEARRLFRRLLATRERLYGADSSIVAQTQINTAVSLDPRDPEGIELLRAARATMVAKRGDRDSAVGMIDLNLAQKALARDQYDDAHRLAERGIDALAAKLPADHPTLAHGRLIVADSLCAIGRCREAIPLAEQARDAQRRKLGAEHPILVATLRTLGRAQVNSGARAAGLASLRASLALAEKTPDPVELARSAAALARGYIAVSRRAAASAVLARIRSKLDPSNPDHAPGLRTIEEVERTLGAGR